MLSLSPLLTSGHLPVSHTIVTLEVEKGILEGTC